MIKNSTKKRKITITEDDLLHPLNSQSDVMPGEYEVGVEQCGGANFPPPTPPGEYGDWYCINNKPVFVPWT